MNINITNTDQGMMLHAGDITCPAAIGKHGLITATDKREGDGKTPIGGWPLRCIYYRPDRITLPPSALDTIAITRDMGWCDDPSDPAYNTEINLPFMESHEMMWRDDHAYDVVIPLGYNDGGDYKDRPVPGRGSAIFFHLRHDGKNHTEGCVAIDRNVMLDVLPLITKTSMMHISA